MSLRVWVAGTSVRTRQCLQALLTDTRIQVEGVITPAPKPTGRKAVITQNPVHETAENANLSVVLVENKLGTNTQATLKHFDQPDILLVVDFGYLVPAWLLNWPTLAPVNIHPSQLPRWRGSSPGQFTLLFGEDNSAVTVMVMNEGLDTGPIITQPPFVVDQTWTSAEYYAHAFNLIAEKLADILVEFSTTVQTTSQPEQSPTPTARRLDRDDGFVAWDVLKQLLTGSFDPSTAPIGAVSELLLEVQADTGNIYTVISRAIRAFSPWPGVWTTIPTTKGDKRLKIISLEASSSNRLVLDQVQLEGQSSTHWKNLQTSIPDFSEIA